MHVGVHAAGQFPFPVRIVPEVDTGHPFSEKLGLQGQGSLRRLAWRFHGLKLTEYTSKLKDIKINSVFFP